MSSIHFLVYVGSLIDIIQYLIMHLLDWDHLLSQPSGLLGILKFRGGTEYLVQCTQYISKIPGINSSLVKFTDEHYIRVRTLWLSQYIWFKFRIQIFSSQSWKSVHFFHRESTSTQPRNESLLHLRFFLILFSRIYQLLSVFVFPFISFSYIVTEFVSLISK